VDNFDFFHVKIALKFELKQSKNPFVSDSGKQARISKSTIKQDKMTVKVSNRLYLLSGAMLIVGLEPYFDPIFNQINVHK